MVVVVVAVAEVQVMVVAVQGMLQVMEQALHRRTFCVVLTWRTGKQEFKALMRKKVPACTVCM